MTYCIYYPLPFRLLSVLYLPQTMFKVKHYVSVWSGRGCECALDQKHCCSVIINNSIVLWHNFFVKQILTLKCHVMCEVNPYCLCVTQLW